MWLHVIVDSQVATPPQLQLEFKCFLIDHKTNKHVPVSRRFAFLNIFQYWIVFFFKYYIMAILHSFIVTSTKEVMFSSVLVS